MKSIRDLSDFDDAEDELKQDEISERMNDEKVNYECHCSKVLIVDDELFNSIALEGLLKIFGINNVDRAFNGLEALKKLESSHKDPLCGFRSISALKATPS